MKYYIKFSCITILIHEIDKYIIYINIDLGKLKENKMF